MSEYKSAIYYGLVAVVVMAVMLIEFATENYRDDWFLKVANSLAAIFGGIFWPLTMCIWAMCVLQSIIRRIAHCEEGK